MSAYGALQIMCWLDPVGSASAVVLRSNAFHLPLAMFLLPEVKKARHNTLLGPPWDSRMRLVFVAALVLPFSLQPSASAHPGGFNGEGCHNNRKTGGYHCHRGGRSPSAASWRSTRRTAFAAVSGGSAYFANCAAARAAGAAPVRAGAPGYSRKLDRDGDGVGCE